MNKERILKDMALKFNCKECNGEIIVKYIKPGEVAKCLVCGAESTVPVDAEETAEEPDYRSKAKGKARSVKHDGEKRPVNAQVTDDRIINPPKRFETLELVAKVLKILALIVLIFSVISAVAICGVSEGNPAVFIIGFMGTLYGLVAAVAIFVYAEIILLFIYIEENTRVVREIAVRRYVEENAKTT